MAKGSVIINVDRCKGCEICTTVCPKKVLGMDEDMINAKGYHPSKAKNPEDCIGCAICAMMCPDVAITVMKEDK